MTKHYFFFLIAATLAMAGMSQAATITIVNLDGAGEGFNDPTPVSPVGGNDGTTVGQRRLNVFQRVAQIWGSKISSAESCHRQSICGSGTSPQGDVLRRNFPANLANIGRDFLFAIAKFHSIHPTLCT